MLILKLKLDESVIIGGVIRVMVTDVGRGSATLGISAPREVSIVREELLLKDKQRASA